jgi:hypothetical protein
MDASDAEPRDESVRFLEEWLQASHALREKRDETRTFLEELVERPIATLEEGAEQTQHLHCVLAGLDMCKDISAERWARYIQAAHEENLRSVDSTNRSMADTNRSMVKTNRMLLLVTIMIAVATGLQAYGILRPPAPPQQVPAAVLPK